MTSFELLKEINDFLHPKLNYSYLVDVVAELARIFDEHEERVSLLVSTSSDKLAQLREAAQTPLVREMDNVRKTTKYRELFNAVDNLESNLGELVDNQPFFDDLKRYVTYFASAYETFLREYPRASASVDVLRTSKMLHCKLKSVSETLTIISANLGGFNEVNEEREGGLSLVLHPSDHLKVQVDKLQALVRIYEEVCRLLNISTSEYPLKVIKIESGSLWAKLFGESQVIKLMTDLIRSGVDFLHRNYTREGEMITATQRMQLVEANLNLEVRLREQGIDTLDMRENIRKAGTIISKESLKLFGDEGAVSINDEYYSVGSAVDRMIAERTTPGLLEDGKATETKLLGEGEPQSKEPSDDE